MKTSVRPIRRVHFESLEDRQLLAADVQVVADLNQTPVKSDVRGLATLGDHTYFSATDRAQGLSLWKTDGTETGTTLVKGLGLQASHTFGAISARDQLFFFVEAGIQYHELWTSDGTESGTQQLKRLPADPGGARGPGLLTAVGDNVFFSAWDEAHGQELWKTDGTQEGTGLLKDLRPGFDEGFPGDFVESDGRLLFTATTSNVAGTYSRELWASDGTEDGTQPVVETAGTPLSSITTIGTNQFFVSHDAEFGQELWVRNEGGEARQVKDIHAGSESSDPRQLTAVDGTLYFVATDGIHGQELWKSDGTEAGTQLVVDLHLAELASLPQSLTVVGDELYFVADAGGRGRDLWKSDGTAAGTTMLYENPSRLRVPSSLTNAGGTLYFSSDLETNVNATLWKSHGTPEGTTEVQANGEAVRNPRSFNASDGELLFTAADEVLGRELWKSDGTDAGTQRVLRIPVGTESSHPYAVTLAGQQLFFLTRPRAGETMLWTTDGTANGTRKLADLKDTFRPQPTAVGNQLYFVKQADSVDTLWVSDGTEMGTRPVKEIPGTQRQMATSGDLLFMEIGSGRNRDLWRSDGTEQGTYRIDGVSPDWQGVLASQVVSFDGKLYFTAKDDDHGSELWSSDGTQDGTSRVIDLAPGIESSHSSPLGVVNGTLIFSSGGDVYRTDGTEGGTGLIGMGLSRLVGLGVGHSVVVGDYLYFSSLTNQGYSIVRTDGTEAGTQVVIGNLPTDDEESLPYGLTKAGDHLFFITRIGIGPYHAKDVLWQSDGTQAGTSRYPHFYPDLPSEGAGSLIEADGKLLASVNGDLWQLDPATQEATQVVDEFDRPVPRGHQMVVVDDDVFYSGTTPAFGNELVRLSLGPTSPHRTGDFNSDGVTNFADFLILSANFGQEVVDVALGDADEDGLVGFADFLLLSANFKGDD